LTAGPAAPEDEAPFFAVVQQLLRELRGADGPPLQLDDELERTLGIDSLARMELMLRLDEAFGVRMPEALVQEAATLRDLRRALKADPPRAAGGLPVVPPPAAPMVGQGAPAIEPPRQAATLPDALDWHAQRHRRRRPRAPDAGRRRRQRRALHARPAAGACAQRGCRPAARGCRAGRERRADAADRARILRGLRRHLAGRGRADPDLSAVPRGADRGTPAAAGRHPRQRRC
jgi:acyl carrier protein